MTTEPRERQIANDRLARMVTRLDRRLEVQRAEEASRYRRALAPRPWWRRLNWWIVLDVVCVLIVWGLALTGLVLWSRATGW